MNRNGVCVFRLGQIARSTNQRWPTSDLERAAVVDALDRWLASMRNGEAQAPRSVAGLAAAWLDGPGATCSAHVQRHMAGALGLLPEGSLLDVARLVQEISRARDASTYAAATLHKRMKSLKRLFAWGVEMGWLARNPVSLAGMPHVPRKREMAQFSRLELAVLCFYHDQHPARYDLLWRWLYYTGMRIAEALALRWEDVSETEMSVRGKGDRSGPRYRAFPLEPFPEVVALLGELRGLEHRRRGFLFPWSTPPGGALRDALKALRWPRRTLHSFRSSCINRWGVEYGWSAELIGDLVGNDPSIQRKHYRARSGADLARVIKGQTPA